MRLRRLFVDEYGLRAWALVAIAVAVCAAVVSGCAVLAVWASEAERRDCVAMCVRAEIEKTAERCEFRCRWERRK